MAWMRTKVKVDKKAGPLQRKAIAQEVIDFIVERTREGKDKKGKEWTGKAAQYSDAYKKNKKFRIAKSPGNPVNLTLSREMLNSIKLLSHRRGELLIGFENNTPANSKAEGNIKGTYGRKTPIRGKARDFLGISRSKLKEIQDLYIPRNASDQKRIEDNLSNIAGAIDDNLESNN